MAKKSKSSAARRRQGSAANRPRPAAPRAGTAPTATAAPAAAVDAGGFEPTTLEDLEEAGEVGGAPDAEADDTDQGPAPAAAPAPVARRVGRVDPAARRASRPARGAHTRADPELDPEDAAIPLARVPYATADLRRVGVMAGLMVVLIIIAAVIVSAVVK